MKLRTPAFDRYPLTWLAILAAVLGVAIVRLFPMDPRLPDSLAFEAIARSLLAGHGFTYREPMFPGLALYAFRAPGYSVMVALGMLLGGVGSVIAMQGALNGVSAALVGSITGRLAGPRAAWIAFAIRFLWPAAWVHARYETSEILFEFLGVFATWLVMESVERRRVGWAVGAGLACAVSLLVRPVGLATAAVLTVWLWLRFPRAAFGFALALLLGYAPWPVRNLFRFHAVVPFTTTGGVVAWLGTEEDGSCTPPFVWMSKHADMGELALDRGAYAIARAEVRAHPLAAAKRIARGGLIYLGPLRGRYLSLWLHRFAMLAALAALLLAGSRARLGLPAMIWAAQGALLLPLIIVDRYRFPAEWCVVVAAAVGLVELGRRYGPRAAAGFAAVALALCVVGSWVTALR